MTHLLARLDLPTLVLHSRDDQMNDFEDGRFLAANIAGARLVALEGSNHIALEDEPAWPVLLAEITAFIEPDRHSVPGAERPDLSTVLTERELQVLTLAAEGHDNAAIADSLSLSVRTVERHLQNVYAKLDIRGKSARTAAVARLLTPA